jgi:hypothetical protein
MNLKINLTLIILTICLVPAFAQNLPLPHLETKGTTTQLIVKGKPFLIMGGEIHNSSASSASYMAPLWDKLKRKNLNTVIAPVYWELLEPSQGKFDFTLVDSLIVGARKHDLHLVILWFGSWKNGYSMYVPSWIKDNTEKYPRAKDKDGNSFEMLSALNNESMRADAWAFKTLMRHIKEVDKNHQTVIAIQVENEVGLFSSPRDYGKVANEKFERGVPNDLMKYLTEKKGKLQPALDSAWKANGYKKSGSWEEVFGKSKFDAKDPSIFSYLPEELFTVYHYAKYIGAVAAAGKSEYGIPMYVNCWIKQPANFNYPGKYPSGGPTPHTLDLWRAAAPSIDFISPDIYAPLKVARSTMEQYHQPGNPLFIPEYRPGAQSAREAFWAYGQLDAICFSPFGIEDSAPEDDDITKTYEVLNLAKDQILENQGKGTMVGIYVDSADREQEFDLNGYHFQVQFGGASNAEMANFAVGAKTKKMQVAGGLIIANGPDQFIVIGKDFSMKLKPLKSDPNKPLLDVDFFDEGYFKNGKWVTIRRLNGDEGTGGGDYGFGFMNNKTAYIKFQRQKDDKYSLVSFKVNKYN